MKKSPKAPEPRRYEAHIYMDEADYKKLKAAADRDLRRVGTQATYYIKRALEAES